MAAKLQPVRGTHDILPEENRRRRFIVDAMRRVAEACGFGELTPPIFEFTEVFARTLGDTSDVVTKEMYTFQDRGGESLTLRPEFTAGVVRAFLMAGLQQDLPCKFFYQGPAFRYERPQKGRLRQFHQVGAELLGVAEPLADVETIAMAWDCMKALGLEKKVRVEISSLGTKESRQELRSSLVNHLSQHRAELSEESNQRLERNPLRILDSKDPKDLQTIVTTGTMSIVEGYLSNDAVKPHFDKVREGLEALSIPYTVNPKIVRGLDYYSHTVFEFIATEGLGAQSTVLAGGRYDGLVEQMGGPPTPGVGWSAGLERLLELFGDGSHIGIPAPRRPIAVIPVDEPGEHAMEYEALKLARELRQEGHCVELLAGGKLDKRMKRANKLNARVALFLGEKEMRAGEVTLKDLDTRKEDTLSQKTLAAALAAYK